MDKTQEHVTGTVKIKLYKGNVTHAGVTSPETLYSEELATFDESDYDQMDSQGFINLWGLPDKVQALRRAGQAASKQLPLLCFFSGNGPHHPGRCRYVHPDIFPSHHSSHDCDKEIYYEIMGRTVSEGDGYPGKRL